ncbi:MAG: sigma factor-like helix-turn-helix DNA-binding protein [Patescibacteria group bacterium]
MEEGNSILDKVISSKKTNQIEQFNPSDTVSQLLKALTTREEDVLRRRFGLLGKEKETLEEIGATYKVTRERIRQIEKTAIQKISQLKNFNELIASIENTVYSVLEQHGAAMEENDLLAELLQVVGDSQMNRQNILFVISELLKKKFKTIRPDEVFKQSWQLSHAPIHLIRDSIKTLFDTIAKNGKPATISSILSQFKETDLFKHNPQLLTEEAVTSYLNMSNSISRNPFDEFGLKEWGSIVPKRMNDKIYLVLKRHGKPMHFTEIAQKINEVKFDTRKAYPPTVHNELILNSRYVLVGRGIYALKEWGYKPGVVSNVLIDILNRSSESLTRSQLVEKVLEQRIVKKNTIHLALTDKTKFKKNEDGTYSLAVPS